jgi:hypothetical protein
MEARSFISKTFLSSAKSSKVFSSLRDYIAKELELDGSLFISNFDFEKNFRV